MELAGSLRADVGRGRVEYPFLHHNPATAWLCSPVLLLSFSSSLEMCRPFFFSVAWQQSLANAACYQAADEQYNTYNYWRVEPFALEPPGADKEGK